MTNNHHRRRFPPGTHATTGAAKREELSRRPCEFPTVNPKVVGRPHRFVFVPGSAVDHPVLWGPNQVLLKFAHEEAGPTAPGAKPACEARRAEAPLFFCRQMSKARSADAM